MKTIKTSIKKLGIFTIGQQNDSDVLDVVFDITEWKELYPYLTSYGVLVTSPDGIVYPANTEVIENVLVWHVSGADTAVVGEGEYQIVAVSESGNKKHTTPQKFSIIANMPGIEDAGDMPEYIEPWYEGVVQAASEAKESAQKAEAAAERAENTGISTEKIEEAVGDYLGKNPPKAPVQSVNGKTGAVQLTASDVDAQQKGNYALKSEIPSPYTLPTATAETKGGVMIGKGLRMVGEALEVVPEGEYELIETIEYTVENQRVVLKQTPDGRLYNFSALHLFIKLNGAEMSDGLSIGIWNAQLTDAFLGLFVVKNSGNKDMIAEFFAEKGLWQIRATEFRTSGNTSNYLDGNRIRKVEDNPVIGGISMSNWPVGTTIEVRGVWKDE